MCESENLPTSSHDCQLITFKKPAPLSPHAMVYDVVVVGGGPAGLTAGIYARTRSLSTLILEAQRTGGQLTWLYPTKSVYDYPSYIAIEGGELGELFTIHARESGAEMASGEVVDVERSGASFRLRVRDGRSFEARAVEIGAAADPLTGTFTVEFAFEAPDLRLAQGLVAKVVLQEATPATVPVVPVSAVLEANGGSASVYVVDGQKPVARRVAVRTGRLVGDRVEIVEGGHRGERVVTEGAEYLRDGMAVAVLGAG